MKLKISLMVGALLFVEPIFLVCFFRSSVQYFSFFHWNAGLVFYKLHDYIIRMEYLFKDYKKEKFLEK